MSTIPIDPSTTEAAATGPRAIPRIARSAGGRCGNCGFEDSGYYCSRCGEPLHGTRDTVLQILWSDLVEGPVHNLFALAKTTWLMLVRPRRFFDGVLRRQHGMTHVPFFLSPVWRRVSHRPHGVPNAVKYFVLIYTLTFLGAWAVGVNVFPSIPIPFRERGAVLPGTFSDSLFLLFVVFAAWMYSKAVSMLLGGKIETETLTRFMLYLNGFALIPFVGISMTGTRHPWACVASLAFWLYVLFVLPQRALPHIFGVSRKRLAAAQAGAAAANLLLAVAMVFCAGIAADLLLPRREAARAEASASEPFDATASGISAVERMTHSNVFPLDTMFTVLDVPVERVPFGVGSPPARGSSRRSSHRPAGHDPRPPR